MAEGKLGSGRTAAIFGARYRSALEEYREKKHGFPNQR